MNKKALSTILAALLLVGLIALLWWWFLSRVPQTLPPSGTFNSAGNKTGGGGTLSNKNNLSAPIVAGLGPLGGGTYVLKSVKKGSTVLGTYTVTPANQPKGAYTITANAGAPSKIPFGNYSVESTSGQSFGIFTAAPVVSGVPVGQMLGTYQLSAGGATAGLNPSYTIQGTSTLASGVYLVKSPNGATLGSYTVTAQSQPAGTYTSNLPLPAGQYTFVGAGVYTISTIPAAYTLASSTAYTAGTVPSPVNTYLLAPGAPLPAGQYVLTNIVRGTPTTYTINPGETPNIPQGTYTLQTTGGQTMGFYTVDGNNGTYIPILTTPVNTISVNTGVVATSTPYLGVINTPDVHWFVVPTSTVSVGTNYVPIDTATIDTTAGSVFNPTGVNGINGSNPSGGLLPNFDASLNGGNGPGGIGLTGALVGAGIGALVGCGANLAASALGLGAGGLLGGGSAAVGTGAVLGTEGGKAAISALSNSSPAAASVVNGAVGGTSAALPVVTEPITGGVEAVSNGTAIAGNAGGTGSSAAPSALASVFVSDMAMTIGQIFQGLTLSSILAANTTNTALHTADRTDTFLGCVARTAARAALRQITTSVVNWINSGFKGSPSFVTNPTQFFTNVADVAAGQFIQGSALSFLCSPFKLQIRIAIAYSYAHQNDRSCTLTGITNNINNFINGSFNSGGWPTFLSFTITPTNNPYGAYAYAQNGLNNSIANAQSSFAIQLNQGRGFLSLQQQQNCKNYTNGNLPAGVSANQTVTQLTGNSTGVVGANGVVTSGGVVINAGVGAQPTRSVSVVSDNGQQGPTQSGGTVGTTYEVCDLVTTTPGAVIAGSIDKTLGVGQDSLNMAKNFDEIISALITQLMTNVLQLGLTNVSGTNGATANIGYTPDQQAAQAAGQTLITQMRTETTNYQQLGTIKQGEIHDIQIAQSTLSALRGCWQAAVTQAQNVVNALRPPPPRSGYDAEGNYYTQYGATTLEIQQFNIASTTAHNNLLAAQARVQAVGDAITFYESKVTSLNNDITGINTAIALLEQYQSRALSVGSGAEVSQLTTEYAGAQVHITQTDLTTEQQNRTSIQTQITTLQGNITTSQNQCTALRTSIAAGGSTPLVPPGTLTPP